MKAEQSVWTRFHDMHSGGGQKEKWGHIFIEATEQEAKIIFYNRFGHNPERVSCTCCGDDYSISQGDSLHQATAYERACDYAYFDPIGNEVSQSEAWKAGKGLTEGCSGKYVERGDPKCDYKTYRTLSEYIESGEAHFICAKDIKPNERIGDVPTQGFVWKD